MVLANHVAFDVDQENQADVPENGDLVTVVHPADFVVNTISDAADATPGDGACATGDGSCSLRAAVEEANAQAGAQTISLADWQVLVEQELPVTQDLTITGLGAGQTIVGSNGQSRLFNVAGSAHLTLDALTLQGGSTTGDGGAITNGGTVTLTGVQVSGNHADGSGGAIYNAGTLRVYESAITGNDASGNSGNGAGAIANSGALLLQNVTVSGNQGMVGAVHSSGSATLQNATVARNHASGNGGGIAGTAANFSLRNTLLAANTADGNGQDCAGGFTSQGTNLLGSPAGCSVAGSGNGDVIGQEPRLGNLEMAPGATTLAHPLRGGSPAIDAGSCQHDKDQRGAARPVDGDLDGQARCDIGAYEFEPPLLWLPAINR
jgi:CSLREA domain-containing protein